MRSARDPQSYHLSSRLDPRPPEDSAGCWQAISRAAARAADAYGARGAHSIEFWDDAFMEESSLDPEQLIKIGEEHIRRKGLELIRSTSIVFNSYGMDIGKLVYLLTKPEIVVELEWHFNPEVTIKAASIPYFRLATSSRLNELLQIRP